MSDYVVLYPYSVVCPSCSNAMHRTGYHPGTPLPTSFDFKCLNSRCPEHGAIKRVPLQRVNTEAREECHAANDG
jgi:hypothetical protein